ncbi:hypothetical protein BDR06DRAFT_971999 [Suillus hirtellus]|nr:hypothetical protein BDR06DRAFT_971999 [Suillus hirtellus]
MEKLEEQLENGLSQMKTATLYKGYKAKLLTHEVAHQRLFLSTLEAEEASLTACYADAICAENKEHFGSAEEELQHYRSHFPQRGRLEADDNRNYLQAVYEDECQILCTVNIQTDQVVKILDKHIAQSLMDCTGYFPMRCCFCNEVQTTEPFHKDSDVTPEGSDDVENEHLSIAMCRIEVLMVHAPLPFVPPPSPPTDFWSLHDMQPHFSGGRDTIDFDGLAFGAFLEESGAKTSGTSTSHASTTAPMLISWLAEINALYPLPPPRALQGTIERTQCSHQIPVPYPLPEPKVMPLSMTTTLTPQTLQHVTSVDVPITPTIIALTDLAAPIVPVTPIVISIDPAPQQLSTPVSIWVSADIQKQITWTKREVIDLTIAESTPLMNGMNRQWRMLMHLQSLMKAAWVWEAGATTKESGDSELDTDTETDDDLEELESVVKFLSAEIPNFVSTSEAKRHDFLLTQPTWPHTSESVPKLTQKTESFLSKSTMATKLRQTAEPSSMASRSRQTAEPFPFSSAQPKAPMASRAKAQSACDYHSNDVEELEAASNDYADLKSPNNNFLVLDDDDNNNNDHHGHSQGPKLVWSTKAGKLKLTDQNDSTQCVVQQVILEAKTNKLYASALASLEENNPVLQATKPYSADILPYLMKGCYFNGSKSVGMKFTDHFKEIAGNKAQRPEVTILMVALTSTLRVLLGVCCTLVEVQQISLKFNFMGNQFSEVYTFHVNFLNKMEENVLSKFHKSMADIFSAVQKVCSNGTTAIVSHKDAMAFLDLDGMDDDK